MKYFFLSEGWTVSRVWASDGLWSDTAWRRRPDIEQLNICLVEQNEKFWLYRVENAILTVEVKPRKPTLAAESSTQTIGQVVLKRLISADQVIERLGAAGATCQLISLKAVVNN